MTTSMRSGFTSYGYTYLEGGLVKNPIECKVVLQIMNLWTKGKSSLAIAKILNELNIPARLGKKWVLSVVWRIIDRHKKGQK